MSIINNDVLSPREHILLEKETEENRKMREHAVLMKRLEIEDHKQMLKLKLADAQMSRKALEQRQKLELKTREVEAHYSQLYRIPLTIIRLPVYIILAIGYTIKREEPTTKFWEYLK